MEYFFHADEFGCALWSPDARNVAVSARMTDTGSQSQIVLQDSVEFPKQPKR